MPSVNILAVLVSAVAIFALGGLWYSRILFAERWMALQGKTREEITAGGGASPGMYVQVFICGLLVAAALAVILNHFVNLTLARGIGVAVLCWLGFAAATSYGSALFSSKPRALWVIDTGYNLVAFVLAAVILTLWR
ncbi:MAG: hypothetical protein JWM41_1267 [Gemmatimonadetes bacterium]|nr:hypothetical protein [Gemmatimonadota bacterium]